MANDEEIVSIPFSRGDAPDVIIGHAPVFLQNVVLKFTAHLRTERGQLLEVLKSIVGVWDGDTENGPHDMEREIKEARALIARMEAK